MRRLRVHVATETGSTALIIPANLLVVFLLVGLYNLARGRSRQVLQSTRPENPEAAREQEVQPGGYDFLWVLRSALATDRGGTANHGHHSAQDLWSVPHPDVATGSRIGQRNLPGLDGRRASKESPEWNGLLTVTWNIMGK